MRNIVAGLPAIVLILAAVTACKPTSSESSVKRAAPRDEAGKAAAAASKAGKRDEERILGTWQCASSQFQGKEQPGEGWRLVFDGKTVTSVGSGPDSGVVSASYALRTDKTPREIDGIPFTPESIYKLSGGTLTICSRPFSRKQRPTEFLTKPGDESRLFVLKRVSGETHPTRSQATKKRSSILTSSSEPTKSPKTRVCTCFPALTLRR